MSPALFHGSASYPAHTPGPVVTVGNFDGVHLGHRALVRLARERADALGAPCLVYTFDPAPRDVLRPDNDIPRIQCLEDKLVHLGDAGAHQVVVERFTRALGARGPRWFAETVLAERLGASEVVLGWNFRFGAGREGDVHALSAWLDVPVQAFGPHLVDGEVVSSSAIRMAVRAGDVDAAARLLGRPHNLLGEVVPGDRRGRELGFPTANVRPRTALVPADGVYAVRLDMGDGIARPAVANMGLRPTLTEGRSRVLEVHVLDFQGDLYGHEVRVDLVSRIRGERRFDGSDSLVSRIEEDVEEARSRLRSNPGV